MYEFWKRAHRYYSLHFPHFQQPRTQQFTVKRLRQLRDEAWFRFSFNKEEYEWLLEHAHECQRLATWLQNNECIKRARESTTEQLKFKEDVHHEMQNELGNNRRTT